MIDGALATTMLIGSTLGTTGVATAASAVRTAVVVQLDEPDVGAEDEPMPVYQPRPAGDGVQVRYQPTPAGDPETRPPSATVPDNSSPSTHPERPRDEPSPVPFDAKYVVRPGDNLWTIAEQHLSESTGRPDQGFPTEEVSASWLQIVEANEDQVQSGDPNLIVPGEHIELP
jgi:nucleoid-associated protein YgaU